MQETMAFFPILKVFYLHIPFQFHLTQNSTTQLLKGTSVCRTHRTYSSQSIPFICKDAKVQDTVSLPHHQLSTIIKINFWTLSNGPQIGTPRNQWQVGPLPGSAGRSNPSEKILISQFLPSHNSLSLHQKIVVKIAKAVYLLGQRALPISQTCPFLISQASRTLLSSFTIYIFVTLQF